MKKIAVYLSFITLISSGVSLHAQFSIGPKAYTRLTDDRVGPTTGFGLHATYLISDTGIFEGLGGGGFDISIPRTFSGTATMEAWDSTTTPYTITVPADLKITDYTLRFEVGIAINPKKKSSAWVATFELRGIFRRVNIDYKQSFNESAYSRYTLETNPYIPAALNAGLGIGIGYVYRYKSVAFYPKATFGFGSNDRRNMHPWNFYPNYLELSISVLYLTPFE